MNARPVERPVELPQEYWDALSEMAQRRELSMPNLLKAIVREAQALERPAKLYPMLLPQADEVAREPKQVLVLRKDLNMRKGKMVAQGAHASMANVFSKATYDDSLRRVTLALTEVEWAWLVTGRFKKICVGVDSEEELFFVHKQARLQGLACSLIQDSGLTEFKEPTFTALAVGPDKPELVDWVTGRLKLL